MTDQIEIQIVSPTEEKLIELPTSFLPILSPITKSFPNDETPSSIHNNNPTSTKTKSLPSRISVEEARALDSLENTSASVPAMKTRQSRKARFKRSSSIQESEPSDSTKRHLRRLSSFMPVKSHVQKRLSSIGNIWDDDDDDDDDDEENQLRNADCFGRRRVTRQRFRSMDSRDQRPNSEASNNTTVSGKNSGVSLEPVASIAELNGQMNEDMEMDMEMEMTNINLSQSCCWRLKCCRLFARCVQSCDNLFRDVEVEVDRRHVRIHWCTNQFSPYIYEEAFVRGTTIHGWEKSFGLLMFTWIVGGGYSLSSGRKIFDKQAHESQDYVIYFLIRAGAWVFCTLIVALNWFCCEKHNYRSHFYRKKSKNIQKKKEQKEKKEQKKRDRTNSNNSNTSLDTMIEVNNSNDTNDTNSNSNNDANQEDIFNEDHAEHEIPSYKNVVLAIALVIFGSVSMSTKA